VFNTIGWYGTACVLIANSFSVLAALLNASVIKVDEPPVFSIYAIQISLLLMPFLVYTASEKASLYISLAFSSVLVIITPLLSHLFTSSIGSSQFASGFIAYQFVFMAIIVLVFGAGIYWHDNDRVLEENNRLIKALQQTTSENEDNKWHTEGLNRISGILRAENNDLQKLALTTLTGLVKYTESLQGTFYVMTTSEGGRSALELYATYAASDVPQKILPGEGLTGQAVLENKTIRLTTIPADVDHISSSLGNARPSSMLIVPLLFGEQAVGVIELSSFNSYTNREVAFLEELGKAIAISVVNVQFNEQKQQLVKQLQDQAEELRAREEELSANIEELSKVQREKEELREKAARRIREQIESQRVLMDKTIKRYKDREMELEKKLADAGIK